MRGAADMMTFPRCVWVILVVIGSCNKHDEPQSEPRTQLPAPVEMPRLVSLPDQKLDSIRIEGSAQKMAFRLFKPASSVPFVTYVPADMIAESRKTVEGEAYYFIANFGGVRNGEAYMLVFMFPAGAQRNDVVIKSKSFRDSHANPGFVNNIDLRLHADRFYYIAQHYPQEYGDGFGPRIQKILDEWQWLDVTSGSQP